MKTGDVGESCDSEHDYSCSVKPQNEQPNLFCLGDLVIYLVQG